MQIFDDQDDRVPQREFTDQAHPLRAQTLRSAARVEVSADVEPEYEAEDLATGEPRTDGLERVAFA